MKKIQLIPLTIGALSFVAPALASEIKGQCKVRYNHTDLVNRGGEAWPLRPGEAVFPLTFKAKGTGQVARFQRALDRNYLLALEVTYSAFPAEDGVPASESFAVQAALTKSDGTFLAFLDGPLGSQRIEGLMLTSADSTNPDVINQILKLKRPGSQATYTLKEARDLASMAWPQLEAHIRQGEIPKSFLYHYGFACSVR